MESEWPVWPHCNQSPICNFVWSCNIVLKPLGLGEAPINRGYILSVTWHHLGVHRKEVKNCWLSSYLNEPESSSTAWKRWAPVSPWVRSTKTVCWIQSSCAVNVPRPGDRPEEHVDKGSVGRHGSTWGKTHVISSMQIEKGVIRFRSCTNT